MPSSPISKAQELVNLVVSSIGTDVSPLNLAPKELSCAEGVSNLLSKIIPFPSSILSTVQLKNTLDDSIYCERVTLPKLGTIIVSPTIGEVHGHAGIFIDEKNICSNDSSTGKLQKNYTFDTWIKEMKDGRNLHTYLWDLI